MKITKLWILASLTLLCITTACHEDLSLYTDKDPINDHITELVFRMHSKLHECSRGSLIRITRLTTSSYNVSDTLTTRTDGPKNNDSYEIHTVELDFGNTSGYAILSDTPGIDQIFYYTEDGCIEDTTLIPPLRELVKAIPEMANEILTDTTGNNTRSSDNDISIMPLVKYEWGQGVPFNNYATYCTCEDCRKIGNHMPIGCVTVALGQFIATMKKFNGTFYGNRNIDFESLPTCQRDFSPEQSLAVAHFLQEIALNCQTKFRCGASSSTSYAATNYLRDLGYSVNQVTGNINKQRFINNLKVGNPHIAYGVSSEDRGHMWIVDRFLDLDNVCQYHINWGWGSSNGWSSCYNYMTIKDPEKTYNYYKNQGHLYFGG